MFYVLKLEYKRNMAYRSAIAFSLLASVVSILVQIALWRYLYGENPQQMAYMTAYVILASALKIIYSNELHNMLADKISQGDFALELLKPLDFLIIQYMRFAGLTLSKLTFRVLPVLVLFGSLLLEQVSLFNVVRAIPFMILGHILCTAIFMFSGLLSFVMIESWAVRRLLDSTMSFLSGGLVPIALFPLFLQKIARATPFQYLYDYPLRIMLGELQDMSAYISGLSGVAVWCIIMIATIFVMYRVAIRHCVVQGG